MDGSGRDGDSTRESMRWEQGGKAVGLGGKVVRTWSEGGCE